MWVILTVIVVLSLPWTLRWFIIKPEIWRGSYSWNDTYRGYGYICVWEATPCLARRLKMNGYKFMKASRYDDEDRDCWIKYSNDMKIVYKDKK